MRRKIRARYPLLIIGILFTIFFLAVPVSAAVQTPLPGQGDQTLILYGIHPNAQKNETIRTFIEEHGGIDWWEPGGNRTHRYVCIVPVKASEKKLLYLNNQTAEHTKEPSIVFVKIIDRDEALPIPTPDPDPFHGLYQKYPALKEDEGVQSYIEDHSPKRYTEEPKGPSHTRVYFVDENETFSEYIVDLEDGNVVSGRYLSEDQFSINRSEAIGQAVGQRPEDARIESALLTIRDGDIYWEIVVLEGPKMDYIAIPAETRAPTPITESPGFGTWLTLCGIGAGLALRWKRR